jgi:hypothetical protein
LLPAFFRLLPVHPSLIPFLELFLTLLLALLLIQAFPVPFLALLLALLLIQAFPVPFLALFPALLLAGLLPVLLPLPTILLFLSFPSQTFALQTLAFILRCPLFQFQAALPLLFIVAVPTPIVFVLIGVVVLTVWVVFKKHVKHGAAGQGTGRGQRKKQEINSGFHMRFFF